MVAAGRQCASGSTITPAKYALQSLQMYQEGWGSHLGEHTARGTWTLPEASYTLNSLELRQSFGPLRIPRPLVEKYCCHNYRQHNSGCLYEERGGGGNEVRPSLCPTRENPDLEFQGTVDSSPTHSRRLNVIADKLSSLTQTRQSRQTGPSCQSFSKQYASGGTRPKWACFCHLAQQQTVSTCITGTRSLNMDNDAISLSWRIWTHIPSHW